MEMIKDFKSDKAFIDKYLKSIVLQSGKSKVLICPSLQGRVITSTADGDDGFSFGWVNYKLISSGKILKNCNNWGGEDRFWLGPEGGQFSIFFSPGAKFDLENWQTPPVIDTEAWELISSDVTRAAFQKSMVFNNFSGTQLKAKAEREISILDENQIASVFNISIPKEVVCVGFESNNTLTNQNDFLWDKKTGMLSIWILGQFLSTERNTIILPVEPKGTGDYYSDAYFGKIGKDRLKVVEDTILFKGDGKNRGKIGILPERTKPVIGSYDAENGVLTIVKFSFDKSKKEYVNSMWELQDEPFRGDVVNSYNDGPLPDGSQMGPFYELETSSAAANLKPGECITHLHSTFHFQGNRDDLEKLSLEILGIGFDQCFLGRKGIELNKCGIIKSKKSKYLHMKQIDPALVPKKKLISGAEIPAIGLGTFGSDKYSESQVADAVKGAAAYGYRHFDCASVYGNEMLLGETFREIMSSGIKREELWITSKLWNDMHAPDDVLRSCKKSLTELQLDYLDLYLVHWPFPNFHPIGCDVTSRSPDAMPYIHENFMKTWQAMEKLHKEGLVRHIGTSNMTITKLEKLLKDAEIKPEVNEMEIHPHFQQPELFKFLVQKNIQPIGFSPLGSPSRPERDRTPEDTVDMEDPVIVKAAENHGVHPSAICLKWAVQRGQVAIPFSIKEHQYQSNLDAVIDDPLTDHEMEEIFKIDKNNRLIKGQVFLWKENQTWRDLWDEEEKIFTE